MEDVIEDWMQRAASEPESAYVVAYEKGHATLRGDATGSGKAARVTPLPKPPPSKGGKVSLAFLRDPAVLATLWCKMASGNMNYTMTSYTPTIFMEVLGCDPVQVASYLVWQT